MGTPMSHNKAHPILPSLLPKSDEVLIAVLNILLIFIEPPPFKLNRPDLPHADAVDVADDAEHLEQPNANNDRYHNVQDGFYGRGHWDILVYGPKPSADYDQNDNDVNQWHSASVLLINHC